MEEVKRHDPQNPTKELLELIGEFSKVAKHEVNI